MMRLNAEATRWVDDAFPGFVEVAFRQADGAMVIFTEKLPVVDARSGLTAESAYPVSLT
ncbi:hypothetical protein [Nocardia camponoti]|uniref:Uncharacterized protein n=1 Tax=Nocardia camponoti TaxID=1616106 RepID=A0A917VAY7_9NOCA|nr:hypothetical protein [Nocardia camponoti]GGK59426.1 hypothetical protein GCM10011591_34500 [Nocardia camponoti]